MKTEIQKRIIPRNWLFGRLQYVLSNLNNIALNNKKHFTDVEIAELKLASSKIKEVISNKTNSSEKLKKEILKKNK